MEDLCASSLSATLPSPVLSPSSGSDKYVTIKRNCFGVRSS